ncbi:uncharacterized protein N7511_000863 [Penicillium nucicola]|uniref:uncharacterized protein n=1 Tax=Penicillium nucicola TaxID=1850975 RepID=UPI0025452542|nr:uncharacterized protein N7511_000863 [Penicillium nucicola]KAJ5775852.1 hypothetical protein N7511_000863 [Penicillium nucicola]
MSDVDSFFDLELNTLSINRKLLHRQSSCRDSCDVAAQDAVVFCDHIFENVLSSLSTAVFSIAPVSSRSKIKTVWYVKHMLRLMPQRVVLKQSIPRTLVATWEDNKIELSRNYGRQVTYHVVLHEEKCMDLRSELVHGNRGGHAPCGYAQRLIGQGSKWWSSLTWIVRHNTFLWSLRTQYQPSTGFLKPVLPAGENPNDVAALPVVWMEGLTNSSNKRQKRNWTH